MTMVTRSLWMALALVPLVPAPKVMGQCTSDMFLSGGSADLIHLDGVFISDTQLNEAAAYWSTCSAYGGGFPSFTTAAISAEVQVTVSYHGGSNATCGQTTHTSSTSMVIDLWDQGLMTNGQAYNCNVTDTLAHELGHVLDLDNSFCSGHLMGPAPITIVNGQPTAGERSVASDECAAVTDRWTTTTDSSSGGSGGGGGPICI